MGIGVAGDLVAAGQQAGDQIRTVHRAAVFVLFEIRVVVVGHPAPGGGAVFARLVRIVGGGVPHHVKGTLCAVSLQGFRQRQRQGLPPEMIGHRGQAAGAVVKGHGADALCGGNPLDAADWGEENRGTLLDLVLKTMLYLLSKANSFRHKRHLGDLLALHKSRAAQ